MSEACAAIVQRDDPHLYATALFAPEPGRSRLMVLYAFDCELSRATRASKESLIPRMRLQWWRDMIEEAVAGKPAKAHEVAAPLNELIRHCGVLRDNGDLGALIDAHGRILELPWSNDDEQVWRLQRFQRLIACAAKVLTDASGAVPLVGPVMADAFALRHAHRMAVRGEATLLPTITGSDLGALARGELTDQVAQQMQQLAESGIQLLRIERSKAADYDARNLPALLPVFWTDRVLGMVRRNPRVVLGQLDSVDRPFDGLKLAWRVARGRW
jgi:hypothetical protein